MAAIFDSPVTPTSERIYASLTLLLDPEIVGVAVGILLLSCKQASIYVTVCALPVYGGHIRFTSHPDVGEYSD